ncbi:Dmoj\GI14251-PA-like protein [Anopheles sinensis]|uniref:Dmoj\GI14251-PA-like protein n=1 Tax=Anopheles sinensis TaxID=74873 RepID=A0A084WBH0_ANOSI|nr:Dmoj\GI14251-PA-like protein [Anopheles sinensis]
MAQAEGISNVEPSTTVAVKIMRNRGNESAAKAMISELKMIILVGQHLNIVNLIGAVTENIQNSKDIM